MSFLTKVRRAPGGVSESATYKPVTESNNLNPGEHPACRQRERNLKWRPKKDSTAAAAAKETFGNMSVLVDGGG